MDTGLQATPEHCTVKDSHAVDPVRNGCFFDASRSSPIPDRQNRSASDCIMCQESPLLTMNQNALRPGRTLHSESLSFMVMHA
jgi:hypothetical protein